MFKIATDQINADKFDFLTNINVKNQNGSLITDYSILSTLNTSSKSLRNILEFLYHPTTRRKIWGIER